MQAFILSMDFFIADLGCFIMAAMHAIAVSLPHVPAAMETGRHAILPDIAEEHPQHAAAIAITRSLECAGTDTESSSFAERCIIVQQCRACSMASSICWHSLASAMSVSAIARPT